MRSLTLSVIVVLPVIMSTACPVQLALAENGPNAGNVSVAAPSVARSETAATPSRIDGFEDNDIAAFWRPGDAGEGRYVPGAVTVSKDYARSGDQSVRITVREGDIQQDGSWGTLTERAELDSGKHPLVGRDVWYGFSVLIPPGFPIVENRLVIAQWKQNNVGGSPLVAQRYRGGRHEVTIRLPDSYWGFWKHYPLPQVELGKWHDMIYHIRFSTGSDGCVETWMDGKQVVNYKGVTAFERGKNSIYHKIGLYRDRWKEPMTIYFDNYSLGASRSAVDPSRYDERQ